MRRLAVSTGLTSLGKWGFQVTLVVYAFDHGGAKAVGLVALAQALPAMLLAPFLALVGEQRPRRDVLLVANLLRGAILVAAAVAIASGLPLAVYALAVAYSDGLTNVLIVVVAIDLVDLGPAGVGVLNTAFGLGGLVAGPLMLVLLRRATPTLGGPLGGLVAGLPLIALAAYTHVGLAVAAWSLLG